MPTSVINHKSLSTETTHRGKSVMKTLINSALITFLIGASVSTPLHAQVGGETNAEFSAVPPESERSDPPEVMLSLSRDHQYFFKAYNDYTDLDPDTGDVDANGNPNIETTYKHSFDYFGYFDSYKCYGRSNNRFVPLSINTDKYCSGSDWSGNFLNWATMTRMDVVRQIFYGGKRVVDSNSQTVLRRAFLPHDAHSFAKYYNGNDIDRLTPYNNVRVNGDAGDLDLELDNIDEGITFCNTTREGGGQSQDSTSPPLLRVAIGNYQLWAANERWQCTWSDENGNQSNSNRGPSDPSTAANFPLNPELVGLDSGIDAHTNDPVRANNREFEMDVEVCVSNLIGRERCKAYPSGANKPIGLLQIYGDAGLINFGLMTGSYENNIEGGVLRKNTGPLSDEVDVTGSGSFIFTDTSDSIIKFIDRIRPWGYTYTAGTYRRQNGSSDDCNFQLTDIPNGRCNSWGNPISEIYKETIRYLAGLNPTPAFSANDTTFIDGLTDATWSDPLDTDNQCADLNTILINASVSSYDSNNTDIADLRGGINGTAADASATTTADWTNMVGDQEGITGQNFFIGRAGGNTDEFCSSKLVDELATAGGLCPEAPTVEGSFDMAGIAYYAHNNDIRPDLEGNQTVNTFAISLATNVPIIRVPRSVAGATPVQILPAYRLFRNGGQGGGALVDFKIVKPHTRIGSSDQFSASYYVNWEDSEQGGDYDQDVWGIIDYTLDESANTLEIGTTVFGESTGNPQLFGFVTNGTTADGFHAYSGIENATYVDPIAGIPGCTDCNALYTFNNPVLEPLPDGVPADTPRPGRGQQGRTAHTFDIASSASGILESPLYYAAKYGGFSENLGTTTLPDGTTVTDPVAIDDMPDEQGEWDATNNITGADGPDGLPDNFFFVINPENLFNSLEQSLNKILLEERAASSAVASFASSNGFGNIIIQGTYQELTRDDGAAGGFREAQWTGEIFSTFIDDFGAFREDTNGNGILEDSDRRYRYNLTGAQPQIQYLTDTFTNSGVPVPVSDLNTVWSGGERLRNINNQDIVLQRPYNTIFPTDKNTAGPSRHIFTYFDNNRNGRVDGGEQTDLLDTNINANNFGFFGVNDIPRAQDIVNFTRGFDDPDNTGLRNRTLRINGDDVVYRLGDLVNSTPLVVAGPDQGYNVDFKDESYQLYFDRYKDRRQVAYVGSNGGLLHAFNVGFVGTNANGDLEYKTTGEGGIGTPHPLGAEIWAYAPFNLLPHLQWLTSPFYNHVFYMDGDPQSFDVKIFQGRDPAKYPGGWGTILVVGMRQGGGDFEVEAGGTRSTSRSAYVVLDITDPESEPEVLAEISHENLNLTTSKPDLFYDCGFDCDGANRFNGTWKLVFGSGPTDIKTLTTNEQARIFTYDLESKAIEETVIGGLTPVNNSHVGDVAVADWDSFDEGYRQDDIAYFGTVGREATLGSASLDRTTGAVYRFSPDGNQTSLLYDTDRPVLQKPVALNSLVRAEGTPGNWVFFGTGQYLKRQDEDIAEQERYYGLLEPVDPSGVISKSSISETELANVTDIQVRIQTGVLVNQFNSPVLGGPVNNTEELREEILKNSQGWFRNLPKQTAGPSVRVVDRTAVVRSQLLFVGFEPANNSRLDICTGGEGESFLFAVDQTTGVPASFATLGTTVGGGDIVEDSVSLGGGIVSAPIVFSSEGQGSNSGTVVLQRPDGSLITGRQKCDGTITFDPDVVIPKPCPNATGNGTPPDVGNIIDNLKITRSSWRELYQSR